MCSKDGVVNSVDPDLGTVSSGFTLFAYICLSENLETLLKDSKLVCSATEASLS